MSAANSQTPRGTGNQQDAGRSNLYPKPLPGPISPSNREGLFRIDVVVTDAAGKPVTDLDAKDFTLLDDGRPTPIFSLESSSTPEKSEALPELIFVFDEVNLSSRQIEPAKRVVAEYLRKGGGLLAQPVVLYRFAKDGLYSSAQATINGNVLAQEVEKRKDPRLVWRAGREPHSVGREVVSPRALGTIAIDQRGIPGRKVLVWFGVPESVTANISCGYNEVAELSTRLREARITVNVVSMLPNIEWNPSDRGSLGAAELAMSTIATQTGGLVFDSLREDSVDRCAAEARAFYSLTFDPPRTEHPNEYHNLAVALSRPGLGARTVAGYYNQPVYFDHPRPDLELVTVSQLEEVLRREAGKSSFPRRLGNMELTERLTDDKRAELMGLVRDEREREALKAVADVAEFLAPAPSDALPDPFPGLESEMEILKRTYDYVANSIPKLPDFFAARTIVSYQEPQVRDEDSCKMPSTEEPLRVAFTARGTVLYRNGAEVVDAEKTNRKRLLKGSEHALDTQGTFGPVLAYVLAAAAQGKSTVRWSRWERSDKGNLAVFRFLVPSTTPMFEITYCCLPERDGTQLYRNMTGRYGEFAVDPTSGAVMRLVIEADLDEDRAPRAPLIRSALMVEYGPVEIGGERFICPVRSVSLSRARTRKRVCEWGLPFLEYGPFETLVNDFSFSEYHKFGSESRMLTGFEEIPDTDPPKSGVSQRPTKPQ